MIEGLVNEREALLGLVMWLLVISNFCKWRKINFWEKNL